MSGTTAPAETRKRKREERRIRWVNEGTNTAPAGILRNVKGNSLLSILQKNEGMSEEEHKELVYKELLAMLSRRTVPQNPFRSNKAINEFDFSTLPDRNTVNLAIRIKAEHPDPRERLHYILSSTMPLKDKWSVYELTRPIDPVRVFESNPEMKDVVYRLLMLIPNWDELNRYYDEVSYSGRFTYEQLDTLVDILNTITRAWNQRQQFAQQAAGTRRRRRTIKKMRRNLRK